MLTLAAASYSANPMFCVNKVLPLEDHWVLVNSKVGFFVPTRGAKGLTPGPGPRFFTALKRSKFCGPVVKNRGKFPF